jgi:glycosyltransferase involved in cell wall biosynthesis
LNVALCICTFNRPEGLKRTLECISRMAFASGLRIFVVDNHPDQAGVAVCAQVAANFRHSLKWQYEPKRGIAWARNAALHSALGDDVDFIAMIDDDEWPEPDWLEKILACQASTSADIVCGPVEPEFEVTPPAWAIKTGLFRHRAEVAKTGNILFRANVLSELDAPWFDTQLALSGGEDHELIYRLIARGAKFAACSHAIVHESVPKYRVSFRYIFARAARVENISTLLDEARIVRPRFAGRRRFLGKLMYATNHFFWAPWNTGRFALGLIDLGDAVGMALAYLGYRYDFYSAGSRVRGRKTDRPDGRRLSRPPFTKRAKITIGCYDNWGGLDDALAMHTPSGRGIWGDVEFTRASVKRCDWFGIFNAPSRGPATLSASPNRVFFAIGEPPTPHHRPLHIGQGLGTYVLTTDEAVAAQVKDRRYLITPAMTASWSVGRTLEQLRRTCVETKPKRLSWITSNLNLMDGHRYRLEFLQRLKEKIDFDLYGRGFTPIKDKWDGLAPYRYSIAFENTRARYYFTEKIMDCFVAETMPIYFGDPLIGSFFPTEAMVIIDPDDPDVFERIKEVINSDLWLQRKDAILEAKRRVLEEYNVFARLAKFVVERSGSPPEPVRRFKIHPVLIDFSDSGK